MPEEDGLAAAIQKDLIRPTAGVELYTAAAIAIFSHRANNFSVCGCSCAGQSSSEEEHVCAYHIEAARSRDNMCVRAADLIDNYQIRRVCVWMCDPGAVMKVSLPGDIGHHRRRKRIGRSWSMLPSGAAPTSPPESVLRHMRHQERASSRDTLWAD